MHDATCFNDERHSAVEDVVTGGERRKAQGGTEGGGPGRSGCGNGMRSRPTNSICASVDCVLSP